MLMHVKLYHAYASQSQIVRCFPGLRARIRKLGLMPNEKVSNTWYLRCGMYVLHVVPLCVIRCPWVFWMGTLLKCA